MARNTTIEWTQMTWNPVRGCTRISEGCRHCYAETMAARFSGAGMAYEGLARMTESGPRWTNEVRLVQEAVDTPVRWRQPRRVFVNSMSDLFHEDVPLEFIQRVFETMNRCPQHQFQVLTKRAERLAEVGSSLPWSENIWMGVSVESEEHCCRAERLREISAHVRFVSVEPLLGPIPDLPLDGIHWVIVGGESGHGARPMDPGWVGEIRRQCQTAGVPFFFKQAGAVLAARWGCRSRKGSEMAEWPAEFRAREFPMP